MNKKAYINPELEVVMLNMSQHLLDGSVTMGIGGGDKNPATEGDAPAFEFETDTNMFGF